MYTDTDGRKRESSDRVMVIKTNKLLIVTKLELDIKFVTNGY